MKKKHRASYLTVLQQYNLHLACKPLNTVGYGTFHVGSSLIRQDYHDVDLRCILEDSEYDKMFLNNETLLQFLNVAISEWVGARTGLPIDFQFQKASVANKKFKGKRNGTG